MSAAAPARRSALFAIGVMLAATPLSGTFGVLDPLRPPIPPLVPAPVALAIAALMLAAGAVAGWAAWRRPAPRPIVAAQFGPGAAIAVAALLGFDPATGLGLAAVVAGIGCVGIAIDGYVDGPRALRLTLGAVLAATAGAAAIALAMLAAKWPAGIYAYNNGRAVGTFLNPNECAAYLLVGLAVAGGVLAAAPAGRLRALALVAAPLAAVALVLTSSRWGFAAALAGGAFYALAARDRRSGAAIAVAAVLALGFALGPGAAHHNPRDDTARGVAWVTGLRTFAHFPFSGSGPLAFNRTYDVFRPPEAPGPTAAVAFDPHSLPLAFADGSGLLGLGGLVFGYGVYIRALRRTLRGATAPARRLALALCAGLVALNVHVLLNTVSLYFALSAHLLALALVAARTEPVDAT